MSEVTFEAPLPPPPQARLERLQDSFENRFPKSYLDFLSKNNGVKVRPRDVHVGQRKFAIERFLPIVSDPKVDKDGWADVAVVATQLDLRLAIDENSTRLDIVPIAAVFAGDFIVLDYRKDRDNPGVALWDHELSDDFSPKTEFLASSFAEFLKQLDS